jgi:hypothetical protein
MALSAPSALTFAIDRPLKLLEKLGSFRQIRDEWTLPSQSSLPHWVMGRRPTTTTLMAAVAGLQVGFVATISYL